MLLVNFADTQTTFGRDDFDAMMNTANYQNTGSFRDFYLENSYGQLDIQTTVVGWIQLSKNKNMYSTENMTELISEALTLVQDEIDFSQFDNNGDGELDGLSIIHQGTGQEVTGSTQDIWSHSGELYDTWVDGIRVRTYTIQPELLYNVPMLSMMTVGVFCHEFGHNLGDPDFYDVDYEQNGSYVGTGEWDLMGGGAWGTYGRSSITIGNENVSFHTLDGAEVDVAQRFNAADLKTYVGYRFDRLGFLPFTSYKQTVYELRVWRAVAGTDDFEVVATRDASEYATGSWRDMLLKDPVEIEAGYDYLIGYHASSNVNSFQVVYDPTSVDTGLGNLVQVDGVWRDDLLPANVYFRANLAEPDPTTDFVAGEEPVFKDDYDPLKDAYYPIGFNVYRDDELIGYTSTRCFIDKGASVGNHRYGIACLYEGNNESRILEKTFWASSVDRVEADRRVELSVAGRVVTVTADEPIAVSLYTVDGRRVASYALPAGESTFAVESAGVYLVNLENSNLVQTEKIIIR